MSQQIETPFDNIENAHHYVKLLAEAVAEAKCDIKDEITLATRQVSDRRLQALRIVEYNLEKLLRYLSVSGRTLNDLRSLRRLLFEERPATHDARHPQVARTPPLTNPLVALSQD